MSPSSQINFRRLLQLTPWLMVAARFLIAIALLFDALDGAISNFFMPAFILAVSLDIADGMTARRLNVASIQLRRVDSFADAIFIYSIAIAAWLVHKDLIQPFLGVILLMILLQAAAVATAAIKYRSLPAYHTWSFRLSGILMFLAAMQLFILKNTGFLLLIAFVLASLSCLENIAMTLILPMPTSDVPGVWVAIRLRQDQLNPPDL